jgi:hypothetical protein
MDSKLGSKKDGYVGKGDKGWYVDFDGGVLLLRCPYYCCVMELARSLFSLFYVSILFVLSFSAELRPTLIHSTSAPSPDAEVMTDKLQ